jgi:thioredoxin-like negative regulator of GroEL
MQVTSQINEVSADVLDGDSSKVDLTMVIFVMEGCAVCHSLVAAFLRAFEDIKPLPLNFFLARKSEMGLDTSFEPARNIKPRGFPTVVSFRDGEPVLGWEGFIDGGEKVDQDALVKFAIQNTIELLEPPHTSS